MNDSSLLHALPLPEQGAAASMVATIMPVTVFAKRAMEDRTAKLLLEKVRFFHDVPLWVLCACACAYGMHLFKPEHCNALDSVFLRLPL